MFITLLAITACNSIKSTPEDFQEQTAQVLKGLDDVVCLMDDRRPDIYKKKIIITIHTVLQMMQSASMTLNKARYQFYQRQVIFLGQLIDGTGIKPDPAKVVAIQKMPTPKNISELHRFLPWLINHLSKFTPCLANKWLTRQNS